MKANCSATKKGHSKEEILAEESRPLQILYFWRGGLWLSVQIVAAGSKYYRRTLFVRCWRVGRYCHPFGLQQNAIIAVFINFDQDRRRIDDPGNQLFDAIVFIKIKV